MGVKVIKGIAGQVDLAQQSQNQVSNSNVIAKSARAAVASTDAVISTVRSSRSDSSERLSVEKADKLAKSLSDDIRKDPERALAAVDGEYSISALRDAFGV